MQLKDSSQVMAATSEGLWGPGRWCPGLWSLLMRGRKAHSSSCDLNSLLSPTPQELQQVSLALPFLSPSGPHWQESPLTLLSHVPVYPHQPRPLALGSWSGSFLVPAPWCDQVLEEVRSPTISGAPTVWDNRVPPLGSSTSSIPEQLRNTCLLGLLSEAPGLSPPALADLLPKVLCSHPVLAHGQWGL